MTARTSTAPAAHGDAFVGARGGRSFLYNFIHDNEPEIMSRAIATVRERAPTQRDDDAELYAALKSILDQLADRLGAEAGMRPSASIDIRGSAIVRGKLLQEKGVPLPSVVFEYGAVCHAMTDLAAEREISIPAQEFKILNTALDEGIATAIDAYTSGTTETANDEQRERLGVLAHELRNALTAAQTAFQALKQGRVGIESSTGFVLDRSLGRLRRIVDRALEEVRHRATAAHRERLCARELFADVESLMADEAKARGIELIIELCEGADDAEVLGDRQHLVSAISNLVQNGIKFTPSGKHVWLRARGPGDKLCVEVADECGGLPPGKAEDLFRPFVQKASDRSGLGLGLTITQRTVLAHGGEIRVRNLPGTGCVFEIELKRG
jgi:signal transduction histidine kinase